MPTLLVVDDEPNVLYSIRKGLESETLDVLTVGTASEGIDVVRDGRADAVVLDVRLPDMSGLDAFDEMRRIDRRLPVIIITAYSATETAIEAMKRGAFEYLLKPVRFQELRSVVDRALELSRMRHVRAVFDSEPEGAGEEWIVGQSPPMQEVYKAIGRFAPQDVPVLILGESGTGKELVAQALYHHSRRGEEPFLALNCAALPDTLLESELFGHERGSFTGADRMRIGKFEQAHRGTLFLDEIGDMSAPTQAKVLRLLQDGRFERVGGNETIHSDVRIIAATNCDLEALAAEGKFRQDLYYRLNVFCIRMPPLRERSGDLPLLLEHFIRMFNQKLGTRVHTVAPEAMRLLASHAWPGNVRELQSAVKYALVHAVGEVLTADCLPPNCRGDDPSCEVRDEKHAPPLDVVRLVRQLLEKGESDIYRRIIADVDRAVLDEVLRHVDGNRAQASEILGLSRTTLRAKLASLKIDLDPPASP